MKEFISSVSPKGQITVPAEVRKVLRIKPKDKVLIILEDEGTVRLAAARYPDLASLRGAAGSLKKPLSWQEIRNIAIEDYLEREYKKDE